MNWRIGIGLLAAGPYALAQQGPGPQAPEAGADSPEKPAVVAGSKPAEVAKRVRDPFKRLRSGMDAIDNRSELERHPLDQFQMTGSVLGTGRLRAMVKGPNEKTHFISEGTKIGIRNGRVTKITPNAIYVKEKVINLLGEEEDVTVLIDMNSKPKS